MISILDAMTDLERCDQQRLLALECYTTAIKNVAQYAIETEEPVTEEYRKHLTTLGDTLVEGTPAALNESRANLRALLRDYRDKASAYLARLRDELTSMANALQDIFNTLNQSDGDQETRLRGALTSLRQVTDSDNLEIIRPALLSATESIEQSLEDLRKQHQLTISQFQVEIRVLHRRIDALENAATLDSLTRLFNRGEMERRIRDAREGASLLLVRVNGIHDAEQQFSPRVAQELAGAFTKRLRNSLNPTAVLGRWSEEAFLAIGPHQTAEARNAANWITERLSGTYTCLQDGKTVRPTIQIEVHVLDRAPGADAEATLAEVQNVLKD